MNLRVWPDSSVLLSLCMHMCHGCQHETIVRLIQMNRNLVLIELQHKLVDDELYFLFI